MNLLPGSLPLLIIVMTAILVYSRSHFDDQVMTSAAKLSFNLKIEGKKSQYCYSPLIQKLMKKLKRQLPVTEHRKQNPAPDV